MTEPNQPIQASLERRLADYNLTDRITFDDSAIEQLRKVSGDDWQQAELYAGTAVLDALQQQKGTVSGTDIQAVNITEAFRLMHGGKDIWDRVRYFGTQEPNMGPKGVQQARELDLWAADRTREAREAARAGRLPKYALANLVRYKEDGLFGPEVKIPFQFESSDEEVRAVAENVARFVTEHTGEAQEVKACPIGGSYGVQYFVRPSAWSGRGPLLYGSNYRINVNPAVGIDNVQAVVTVSQERGCQHGRGTLEQYVQRVKQRSTSISIREERGNEEYKY